MSNATGVTIKEVVELFRVHGNISIPHENAEPFIRALNRRKIKYKISQSDKPHLTKFEKP